MSLLELENVVTAYGKVEALKGLTLRVEQGEIVTLLGSNGAGKSTTLRTISGLIRPLSGTMRFLGQPIDRLSPEAIVKLGVAHVPERRRVFPGLLSKRILFLVVRIALRHHVVSLSPTQSECLLSFRS
jgi:branched-chain amino acid transport system ATP-binding protein